MSGFTTELITLLSPAVDAVRAALKDLSPDEVPAALRRVAAYTGGKLPPPLARSALAALDDDEWLRAKTAEKLSDRDDDTPGYAFVNRGEGWWLVVSEGLAAARTGDADAASVRSAAEVDELTAQLSVAKKRLKQAGADLDAERVRTRRRATSEREARRKPLDTKAAARLRETEARFAAAVDDRVEAEAMIARLRTRLKGLLRDQRREAKAGSGRSVLGGDPVATAKALDLMAAAAPHRAAERDVESVESPRRAPAPTLPRGIRPDAREAIEWLAASEGALTVIVDGYNVLFGLDPSSFTTAQSRGILAEQLARLRRSAATARVVVVYDSNLPGDRESRVLAGGVELHYSAEDQLADDKIVDLAAEAAGEVVVVTSDRDLRERAEAVGALTLWSEAFVEWM